MTQNPRITKPNTSQIPVRQKRIWGHVEATIIGFHVLGEKPNSNWGYIPTLIQGIYYKLDDGTIIYSNDGDYLAHSWHLIGTRCSIAVEAQWERMIPEQKYGIVLSLTRHEPEIIQSIRSVTPTGRNRSTEPDLPSEQHAYGQIEKMLPDDRCLVDIGFGTIVVNYSPARQDEAPTLKVGDFIGARPSTILIHNLQPLCSREVITGRLLKVIASLHGEGETNLYIELPNGEVLMAITGYPMIGRKRIAGFKDLIGTTVQFRFTPPSTKQYERLSEPRLGVTSTLTQKKADLFYQWISPEDSADELYGTTEFILPNENAGKVFAGIPMKPEKAGESHTMTFYGILKEIPLCHELLLDTGRGAFFAKDLPDDFSPGDYVKCTVPHHMNIESFFFYLPVYDYEIPRDECLR
jgi:hypothetical protein